MAATKQKQQEAADTERALLDSYVREKQVHEAVQSLVEDLLEAKPDDPQEWLLNKIEADLSEESNDLSESDIHRLFEVSRKITSEIVPQDTIEMVITETCKILHCDRVSLFVLEKKSGMLKLYASNLSTPIVVSPGQGIAGTVFNAQKTVNIADCYKDRRFDKSFDKMSGYFTRSLLAVPIVDFEGTTVGVIQAINKLPQNEKLSINTDVKRSGEELSKLATPFQRNEEKILLHITQHVGIALRNADVYREAIAASERATGLLNTVQSLSQDLGTQSLLLTITMHANKIVSAQRSTVFLVDEPNQQLWSVSTDTGAEIRIPKAAGIAGECAMTGNLINIPDAYADKRFNQAIDKKTGFKTQSMLAIPMFDDPAGGHQAQNRCSKRDDGRSVIGVIQMINKVSFDGQLNAFDEEDIEVMELFAQFVGPKIASSSMLNNQKSRGKDAANEAMVALAGEKEIVKEFEHEREASKSRKRMSAGLEKMVEDEENEEEEED
mmetsp:Transcript_28289/g.49386  ORF Transcript_28289/g.49386 Transcript_28289/m.49386 type:complete len:495 (-) Transcript_28289:67-1551(-)